MDNNKLQESVKQIISSLANKQKIISDLYRNKFEYASVEGSTR